MSPSHFKSSQLWNLLVTTIVHIKQKQLKKPNIWTSSRFPLNSVKLFYRRLLLLQMAYSQISPHKPNVNYSQVNFRKWQLRWPVTYARNEILEKTNGLGGKMKKNLVQLRKSSKEVEKHRGLRAHAFMQGTDCQVQTATKVAIVRIDLQQDGSSSCEGKSKRRI